VSQTARWLRRWMGLAVAVLVLVTVAVTFSEDMPFSHYQAVPVAAAIMAVAWAVELVGVPWPRLALIAAVVLPNAWLTLMGHFGANYLFLLLLVAWVELVGNRAERAAALVLSLATLGLGIAVNAADGAVNWGSWISYLVIVLMAWSMGLVLRRQDRLVAELALAMERQAAITVENERLHERARQAAVLEERERLARELHDSVTQSLYAVSLHAEAAGRALADGEAEPVASNLADIRETVQEALGEMRLLLFELRPPLLQEHGLAAALQTRLRAVEARAGLATAFEGEDADRLRPETEQELYRVAQEALNNVIKHAHASRARVRLEVCADRAALEVVDDGVGFEPALRGGDGYGLPGMRERAARLGGTLRVESAPGAGTRVRVEVPR
jgi:signal transduction histidine kinase